MRQRSQGENLTILNIFFHERTVIDYMSEKTPKSGPPNPMRGFYARVDEMASLFSYLFLNVKGGLV